MQPNILRVTLHAITLSVLIISVGCVYVKLALPNVGEAPEIYVADTPKQIERGAYLAKHVMFCLDCHSKRDWTKFSGPLIPDTEGQGGERFDQTYGFPGTYISTNITPTNLSHWSDGELLRAITTGVSKDGHALFPVMPYLNYGQLSKEDIHAVIAYIRSLPPIVNETKPSTSDFPMNLVINTIPQPNKFHPTPNKTDLIAYGEYLTIAASCYDCHTKKEDGQFTGADYAGGMEFLFPDGSMVRSPNITPHTTGIGTWTETQFIQQFKMYSDTSYILPTVKPGDLQTPMPWTMYAGMSEYDLKAIYTYLKSLEPVEQEVERFVSIEE